MQAGDLVKHKRTGAIGLLLRLPKGHVHGDIWFDVQWCASAHDVTSHLKGELEFFNASR